MALGSGARVVAGCRCQMGWCSAAPAGGLGCGAVGRCALAAEPDASRDVEVVFGTVGRCRWGDASGFRGALHEMASGDAALGLPDTV